MNKLYKDFGVYLIDLFGNSIDYDDLDELYKKEEMEINKKLAQDRDNSII